MNMDTGNHNDQMPQMISPLDNSCIMTLYFCIGHIIFLCAIHNYGVTIPATTMISPLDISCMMTPFCCIRHSIFGVAIPDFVGIRIQWISIRFMIYYESRYQKPCIAIPKLLNLNTKIMNRDTTKILNWDTYFMYLGTVLTLYAGT